MALRKLVVSIFFTNIFKNQKRIKENRKNLRTSLEYKEGLKSQEILMGNYTVEMLEDSGDSIGNMNHECEHCGALKFKKETASVCCCNGKVVLEPFPLPPEEINTLWHAKTAEGRLFREHARSIDNAVCLSSLQVKEPTFN